MLKAFLPCIYTIFTSNKFETCCTKIVAIYLMPFKTFKTLLCYIFYTIFYSFYSLKKLTKRNMNIRLLAQRLLQYITCMICFRLHAIKYNLFILFIKHFDKQEHWLHLTNKNIMNKNENTTCIGNYRTAITAKNNEMQCQHFSNLKLRFDLGHIFLDVLENF